MQDDEEGWIAEFEASGESELRDRLYRGSGMHPEAKFHLAVRWLREQARGRRLLSPSENRCKDRSTALYIPSTSVV
jgi:hypothetical protein